MKDQKMAVIIATIIAVFILSFVKPYHGPTGFAITNVTACVNITSAGDYNLNTSISNSANTTCMIVGVSSVTLDCQGFTIDGADNDGSTGISSTSKTNVTIKNCIVTDWATGISLSSSSNNTFLNNSVSSNTGSGISISGGANNTAENNTIFSNVANGVVVGSSSNYNLLKNNTIYSNDIGLELSSGINTTAINNIIYSNTNHGIDITDTNTTASSNYIHTNTNGIRIAGANNHTISLNNITNSSTDGITFSAASESNRIFNNTVNNATSSGIHILAASLYNIIESNNVITQSNYGIYIQGASDETNSNTISFNFVGNSSFAIRSESNNKNKISNNTINLTSSYGISLDTSYTNQVENNTIFFAPYGIFLSGANNNTFKNDFINAATYGISLSASSKNNFTGTKIINSTQYDIDSQNSDPQSRNNTIINMTLANNMVSFSFVDISIKNHSAPFADPSSLKSFGKFLNISNNTASSWIHLNLSYNSTDTSIVQESTITMGRSQGTSWNTNVSAFTFLNTFGLDTVAKVYYSNITNFGIFGYFGTAVPPPTTTTTTTMPAGGTTRPPTTTAFRNNTTTTILSTTVTIAKIKEIEEIPEETFVDESSLECKGCPKVSKYSQCADGVFNKTVYSCGNQTNFTCKEYVLKKPCNTPQKLEDINYFLIVALALSLVAILFFIYRRIKFKAM
ncbi:TPA: right-handed parallel beta-helix repeat-containing protein [archaeon]|nr:right-handed parallel beta-helix repeat-containing protein [Candidatus Naiadarchaeales archaeon SRR2090153.bin461]